MKRITVLPVLAAVLASCGSQAAPMSPTAAPVTSAASPPAPPAAPDPYDAFLAAAKAQGIAIPPDLDLESALARALLGCGTTWPPKTIDAVLAEAYAVQVNQAQAQGHCH